MRNARKPSNERLFNSKEWLTKSRIQSFFSRLAVSRRKERGIVGLSVEQEKDVKRLVDDAERQGFPWVSLFAARGGTPNLRAGYWRSQLLQDDSQDDSPRIGLYNRAQEDWGRKRKCSQEHNGTVRGTFERSFLSFFLPIFGWDMMKNLNDISTLFKGVAYTRIMASKEEKVRKLRSRHAYVRHELNAAITKRVKTAVETCCWWKTTHNRCFTGFRDDL